MTILNLGINMGHVKRQKSGRYEIAKSISKYESQSKEYTPAGRRCCKL